MNKNYIAVISKTENGLIEFTREDISNEFIDIVDRMKEMKDNPNRTLLDMQQCFTRSFPRRESFNLCLPPHSYSSSYIAGVYYPRILTYDEYNTMMKEIKDSMNVKELKYEDVEKELIQYKYNLKNSFLEDCERYIYGYNFTRTSSNIRNKPQTIMLSSETIGWTSYQYKANEDVTISIHTNFCYGYSSYFFLNMEYKGIEILPYSALVHYYYANIIELRRYTRQYGLCRDSWNVAFDFIVESSNLAKTDPAKFINRFILNEINEMVSGLKNISKHPDMEINRLKEGMRNNVLNGFCYSVRNIWNNEVDDYKVYRDEMNIAFKAEKITGALLFLDKLSQLAELLPTIQNSIDDIKSLNIDLIPEIERTISNIDKIINQDCIKSEIIEKSIETIKIQITPHEENIRKLQESCGNYSEKMQIENKYRADNKHYDQLCSELDRYQKENSRLKEHIQKRRIFVEQLKECQNRIQTYIKAA